MTSSAVKCLVRSGCGYALIPAGSSPFWMPMISPSLAGFERRRRMRKPSREVVETLLDKVLSHGMSEFGGNVIELPVAQSGPGGTIRALRQIQLPDGMEVAPVKLGKRDSRERGHLFPQTEPVHPLDVTTMQ